MRALLLIPESGAHTRDLLGMPIGQRALFAAADAGAGWIEIDHAQDPAARAWASDERLSVPVALYAEAEGDLLVMRADTLVAPALLAELRTGEALDSASGVRLAARVWLRPGESIASAVSSSTARPWRADRYRYALYCDSPLARERAERALLASLVKPSDGPVSRYLNRPISTAISRRLVPLGVTADQMTLVCALAAVAAAFCAAQALFAMHVAGALLFQLHSILDGCDGEIARLTRRSSPRGALLDSLVDDAANLLFFGALSYGVAHHTGASWPLAAGALTVAGYLGVIAVQYAVVLRASGNGDKARFWNGGDTTPAPHSLASLLHVLLRRNVFIALILVGVVSGLASWVVAIFPFAALSTLGASVRRAMSESALRSA